MKGLFITFEGMDGSGKSTQARLLSASLRALGMGVVDTFEPGGTRIGQHLRNLLLTPAEDSPVPDAELLLFMADRAQHMKQVIQPALAAGKYVICDRFTESTIAYQGYARGHNLSRIAMLNRWTSKNAVPDVTFVLLINRETAIQRLKGQKYDLFEQQPEPFQAAVEEGFDTIARYPGLVVVANPDRIVPVDGTLPTHEIHTLVLDRVHGAMQNRLEKTNP